MSKSLGNYIGISEPPAAIYGKTMSIPDALTEKYLRLISGLPPEEVDRTLALGPRDAKAALARRLVERLHGGEAAAQADADWDRQFRRGEQPEDIPTVEFETGFPIRVIEAMVKGGLVTSNREARRLIEQRGVRRNGQLVTGDDPLEPDDVVQVGKRRWMRIAIK
jgi:tyrosyl-tRNA synthetase